MIFPKPKLGTARRRFLWWPRRIAVLAGEYRPCKNGGLVPFVPGFHMGGHGYPPSRQKNKSSPGGGLVWGPAEWRTYQVYDGWYWLEWVVEERVPANDIPYTRTSYATGWMVREPAKQWNLWHEYYE